MRRGQGNGTPNFHGHLGSTFGRLTEVAVKQ